jgi:hypothetical protein
MKPPVRGGQGPYKDCRATGGGGGGDDDDYSVCFIASTSWTNWLFFIRKLLYAPNSHFKASIGRY